MFKVKSTLLKEDIKPSQILDSAIKSATETGAFIKAILKPVDYNHISRLIDDVNEEVKDIHKALNPKLVTNEQRMELVKLDKILYNRARILAAIRDAVIEYKDYSDDKYIK